MPVTRSAPTLAAIASTLLILATACSGGGRGTQDSTSPSSDSSPLTVSSMSSSASSSASPSPSWTPPDYGTAKPAVDAYLKFTELVDKAFTDPAHVPSSTFDKHLGGQAKQLFDSSLAQERKAGKAYRGQPPVSHVRVTKNGTQDRTLPWVELRDCATTDPSNPSVEYDIKTGKPVPQKPHNPPGPYANKVKMFLLRGTWTITSWTADYTRTCRP